MIDALTSHLLQSTIFAGAAALLTLAFRINRAQVRYWLWIAASFKFLIPFAPLTSLGSHIQTLTPPIHEIAASTPFLASATEYFSQPLFPQSLLPVPRDSSTVPWTNLIIFVVWLCGVTALTLMQLRKWQRIRLLVRASVSMAIAAPVEIRSSPGLLEPGVVGLIRPVLLLPQGIAERLTSSEMAAILAHELCHVRRRDNLLACIHMIVETMFWFHPLVWWIGARLLEERERACDEDVVSRGNRPDVYAEAILNVCKLYAASPLVCVSGVTGASLKRRIEAILTNRTGEKLNRAKKILLAAAAAAVLACPLAIGIFGSLTNVSATPSAPEPQAISFEVASVKPSTDPAKGTMFCISGPCAFGERLSVVGSRVNIRFMSLYNLILTAYSIRPNQLSGPDWMQSQRFDIEAKMPESASRKQVPEMLKALLSERFKLAIHRNSKDQPVFALVVGKNGLKLQKAGAEADASIPEAPGDQPVYTPQGDARALKNGGILVMNSEYGPMRGGRGSNGVMQWEYSKLTMPALAALLAPHLDRPVMDMTNLKDSYHLVFQNQRRQDGIASATKKGSPQEESSDVGNAREDDTFGEGLIRAIERAGLKLEARRAPVETIVVDRLEKTPTGN
jgi:bla regulator protein BlaR1